MNIDLFDIVISLEAVDGVPVGTNGTIVEILEKDKFYEIEFFDKNHKTIGCVTMKPSQFRKLTLEEILSLD